MPRAKPQTGGILIPTHPLSIGLSGAYLLNEKGNLFRNRGINPQCPSSVGTVTDLNTNISGFSAGRTCELGYGVYFDGTGYLGGGNPSQAYTTSSGSFGWSIATKFRITTMPAGAATAGISSLGNTNIESAPAYLLQVTSSVVRVLLGNGSFVTVVSSPTVGAWYTVVSCFSITIKGNANGTESDYLGVTKGSFTQVTNSARLCNATVRGASFYLGTGFNGQFAGDVEFCYIWDRELKWMEAFQVCNDPYQMWYDITESPYKSISAAASTKFIPEQLALNPMTGIH